MPPIPFAWYETPKLLFWHERELTVLLLCDYSFFKDFSPSLLSDISLNGWVLPCLKETSFLKNETILAWTATRQKLPYLSCKKKQAHAKLSHWQHKKLSLPKPSRSILHACGFDFSSKGKREEIATIRLSSGKRRGQVTGFRSRRCLSVEPTLQLPYSLQKCPHIFSEGKKKKNSESALSELMNTSWDHYYMHTWKVW